MKNKGVFILAALFILSLIGISWYGGPIPYIFFYTVVLIPVVSYLYILCVIMSLKIYQRTDGRDMVCGTPSDFYITLQNEGWFSFSSLRIIFYSSFSGISDIDDGAVYELPPHSVITRRTKLLCRYRGQYDVGIKKIVVGDFLGIFSVTYRIKEPLNVIVAPAMARMPDMSEKDLLSDADRDNMQRKTEPDIPVREYFEGDDIRFLNWKATALMQKLMVRERRGEEKSGIAIVMDPGRYHSSMEEYLPPENKVIELVLALSRYYMENSIPAEVIYRTDSVRRAAIQNVADYEALYGEMCRYLFREKSSMESFFEELYEGMSLSGYRMIVFVQQRWSASEDEFADRINSDQVPVRVYVVDAKGRGEKRGSDDRKDIITVGIESLTEAGV